MTGKLRSRQLPLPYLACVEHSHVVSKFKPFPLSDVHQTPAGAWDCMLTRGYRIGMAQLATYAECPLLDTANTVAPTPQNTTVATDVKFERFHRGETHSKVHTTDQSVGHFPGVCSHTWDCTTECTVDDLTDYHTSYKPNADMLSH